MKNRPISANPIRRKAPTSTFAPPFYAAKNDLKLLMSSNDTSHFLDSKIFKLTESTIPEHRHSASTQISQELHVLKTFTNTTQLSKTITSKTINRLEIEMDQANHSEIYGKKIPQLQENIETLKEKIAEAKAKQQEKLADREVYFHIEKRLVATKIHLDMKTNFLQNQLNNKQHVLTIEKNQSFRSREGRCRSARQYRNFSKSTDFYNKNKLKLLEKLEKDNEILEQGEVSRVERKKKHIEICEQVDDEENIRRFKGIRDGIMLHRTWYMVLSHKLDENKKKFGDIGQAFSKIKGITGRHDINEVVEKFLTKENSFLELMNFIVQNKHSKEDLQQRNEEMERKIEKATIIEGTTIKENKLNELERVISNDINRNVYEKSRQKALGVIKSSIEIWAKKNIKRFSPKAPCEELKLGELILTLKNVTLGSLASLTRKPVVAIKKTQIFEVFDQTTPKMISFLSKMVTSKVDHEIIDYSELNYVENEDLESKKKILFAPLIEKALKKRELLNQIPRGLHQFH